MSMENLGPYTNFHELNQDWFLQEFNKLIEQWKAMQKNFDNLQDAFNDLKSYIQDYFKNLDVQNEINNKLNEMANDGSLAEIFVPYLNNINSPVVVNSTTEMTDKNKIYLLATNSHLYTYNNSLSSFTDTGIIYGQLNSQFIYDNDRNIQSHDFNDYVNCGGYWLTVTPEENDITNAPFDLKYGDFVIINLSFPATLNKWVLQVVTMNNTKKYNNSVAYRWFNTETKEVTLNWKTLETNFNYTNIYNIATHDFNEFTKCGGYWVTINKETSDAVNAPFDLKYGNFVVNNLSFPLSGELWVMQIVSIDNAPLYNKSVAYRWFDSVNKTSPTGWMLIDTNYNNSNSMYLMGDSITAGYPYEDDEAIRWYNPLKNIFNIDAGYRTGSGLLYKSGNINGISMADTHNFSKNNFVCIFMGTNDYGNDIALGDINDMYPQNETVCGALNYILSKIRSDNISCNIIGILPLNRKRGTIENNFAYGTNNNAGYTLNDLNVKISEIYKKYYCNVIDNTFSPINKFSMNNLLDDGLHPNKYGYRHLSQWFNGHIKSLFDKTFV